MITINTHHVIAWIHTCLQSGLSVYFLSCFLLFFAISEIDRFKVEEVVCIPCSTKQTVSNRCVNCGVEFAKYFCAICKFWDNRGEEKHLFHCDGCGICRVGGRENYFHCRTCGSCYPRSLENNHVCIGKTFQWKFTIPSDLLQVVSAQIV